MNIIINGQAKEFTQGMTLLAIMQSLQIEDKVMAAAINMEIIKKENWSFYTPKENDSLELLQFVGGG